MTAEGVEPGSGATCAVCVTLSFLRLAWPGDPAWPHTVTNTEDYRTYK